MQSESGVWRLMLTDEERQERDPAALQRHLLELTQLGAEVAEQMVAATDRLGQAQKEVAVLKAKAGWIKQEISATQSVLRSMPI